MIVGQYEFNLIGMILKAKKKYEDWINEPNMKILANMALVDPEYDKFGPEVIQRKLLIDLFN